jgi:hypothetical protein
LAHSKIGCCQFDEFKNSNSHLVRGTLLVLEAVEFLQPFQEFGPPGVPGGWRFGDPVSPRDRLELKASISREWGPVVVLASTYLIGNAVRKCPAIPLRLIVEPTAGTGLRRGIVCWLAHVARNPMGSGGAKVLSSKILALEVVY